MTAQSSNPQYGYDYLSRSSVVLSSSSVAIIVAIVAI